MSDDLNRWVGIGRLTRTPELKAIGSGTSICEFSLASGEWRKDGDDYTNFIDCKLWGKRAESLHPYLTQGTQLAVEGKLRQDRWEKDGQKRSKLSINVTSIQLLGSKKDDGSRPVATPQQPTQNQSFVDDVPF